MTKIFDELNIDLSTLGVEPADEYHAKAKQYLSSHQMIDFMTCPWLYRKKQLALIQAKETEAYLLGRAAHCRILEGREAYESQFALGGPINPKTKKPFGKESQAFRGWAGEQGKPGIHFDDLDQIENMASGLSMNDKAVDLLLYGRAEGVLRTEYCGMSCQCRFDWIHPHEGIVDMKTCDDLTWFESDARRYRYINQLAFYQAVLAEVIDELVPVHIVAVEKREPYRCGVWMISDEALYLACQENEAAIKRLQLCREHNHWPTGYEDIRLLSAA